MSRGHFVDKCPHCGRYLVQRSTEQNALLHAILCDISTQKQWGGQNLDLEDWKRLLTAAWERTQGRQARVFPAVDGHGFEVLYRRTSRMSKQELSELCEYIIAWATEQGVNLNLPEAWQA